MVFETYQKCPSSYINYLNPHIPHSKWIYPVSTGKNVENILKLQPKTLTTVSGIFCDSFPNMTRSF